MYRQVNRYLPFIVLGVMVIGFCCGVNSLSALFGVNDSNAVLGVAACLPNLVMQVISWAAVVLVPALTAPMVAEEVRHGTWEMLRLTPYTTGEIVVSKLLGGLARLKIWVPLLVLNGVQLLAGAGVVMFSLISADLPTEVLFTLANPLVIIRPWIEIAWIALTGLVFSMYMSTGRGALVATYAVAVGVKVVNGWLLWAIMAFFAEMALNNPTILSIVFSIGPSLGYFFILAVTALILSRRARYFDEMEMLQPV